MSNQVTRTPIRIFSRPPSALSLIQFSSKCNGIICVAVPTWPKIWSKLVNPFRYNVAYIHTYKYRYDLTRLTSLPACPPSGARLVTNQTSDNNWAISYRLICHRGKYMIQSQHRLILKQWPLQWPRCVGYEATGHMLPSILQHIVFNLLSLWSRSSYAWSPRN